MRQLLKGSAEPWRMLVQVVEAPNESMFPMQEASNADSLLTVNAAPASGDKPSPTAGVSNDDALLPEQEEGMSEGNKAEAGPEVAQSQRQDVEAAPAQHLFGADALHNGNAPAASSPDAPALADDVQPKDVCALMPQVMLCHTYFSLGSLKESPDSILKVLSTTDVGSCNTVPDGLGQQVLYINGALHVQAFCL